MKPIALSIMLALAVTPSLPLAAQPQPGVPAASPADVAGAIASPRRPAAMVARDAGRKPAETLAFFGLERGDVVVDVYAGEGYFTELMALVVGPEGRVFATMPAATYEGENRTALDAVAARHGQVTVRPGSFADFDFESASVDLVMFSMIYHDTYFVSAEYGFPEQNPREYLARVFAAMRPGGTVGVIDHVAEPGGDTREVVEALHRIDPAVIRADFEAAGFVLDGENDALRNPDDDHSLLVFDPAIRGRTDRIMWRFRKPE